MQGWPTLPPASCALITMDIGELHGCTNSLSGCRDLGGRLLRHTSGTAGVACQLPWSGTERVISLACMYSGCHRERHRSVVVLSWPGLTVSMVQAAAELAELTATCDRDQAANEAEWDTLTQLIEADRRQQASL